MTESSAPARALLTPMLLELSEAVKQSAERVQTSGLARGEEIHLPQDDEAVHDFRVALRRLRSLLRPARRVYGDKRVRAVDKALRRFAQATGALRDEEVLRETLGALELPSLAAREELMRWVERRSQEEQAHRAEVIALLKDTTGKAKSSKASLDASLSRLAKLVHRKKVRAISAGELAARALADALDGVRADASPDPADAAAMHALRIRYKRLRYTVELFAPTLGEGAAKIEKAATSMQRRLGDLHDLDEAIDRIKRAGDLGAAARIETAAALRTARAVRGERVRRDLIEADRVLSDERGGGPGAEEPGPADAVDVVSRETVGDETKGND